MDCQSVQSNPSTRRIWYEVFLSFRGEDTRNNFIDHLFAALQRSGIFTFKDDQRLNKGDSLSTELPKAIQESKISIVVFSKNYADSTWCLRELAKIVDCNEVLGQSVLPVFYDVNPSDVRNIQSGSYKEAFAEHEKKFQENLALVHTWRLAMSKVANLSGWHVQNKPESKVVVEIVQTALSMLGHKFSIFADDLVGIQSRVEALENILDLKSNDNNVRVVGIIGMGGIGKTTLATIVYDRISHKFEACSFLPDVSTSSKGDGALRLQKQLLSETLKVENFKIQNLYDGITYISTRLKNLKTLLVLDNVNDLEELENLAKNPYWFGVGSRIIITTRDEHILENYRVDDIYRVGQLNDAETLELLCRKAFKHHSPTSGYEKVTHRALEYVKGLPLAAKVLGLCLFGKDVSFWECTLATLQEHPKKKIMDVLRISYDGLEDLDQQIFLDIACFFHGMYINDVKRILNCCGFYAESGISNLIDKSLLIIINKRIHMHGLLQQLGRNIVQENSPKRPANWSRLWLYKNFDHVMMESKVTEDVEAIVLNDVHDIALRAEALSNITHLRLLIFHNVNFCGSIRSLSNKLKYLEWHGYPFTYMPSHFQPDKLVELIMPDSCIKQLWEGIKPLHNLRSINLKHSKNLIKIDFRGFPNLEQLDLEGCTKLLKLDESIGVLAKLTFLNLNDCKNLVSIPNCIFCLSSLETLCLSGCSKLPLEKTEHVNEVDRTGLSILSIVRKNLMLPFHLFSGSHKGSVGLSLNSFLSLPSLKKLDLSYCNLIEISNSIKCLNCLEDLDLSGNNFITLPSINKLSRLQSLRLADCPRLQSLPELPSSITSSIDNSTGCDYFTGRLWIRNCPMFKEMERCSSLALSWLIKYLEEEPDEHYYYGIIPGSEIPWWFNHQSLGPSTRIQLPPNARYRDSNWLGIAVCALYVCVARDYDRSYYNSFELSLNNVPFTGVGNIEGVKVGFSELWLECYNREYLYAKEVLGKETQFIDVKFGCRGGNFEIKKCGVRLVYKEDVERLKQKMMQGGSAMQIDDDGDLGIADFDMGAADKDEPAPSRRRSI